MYSVHLMIDVHFMGKNTDKRWNITLFNAVRNSEPVRHTDRPMLLIMKFTKCLNNAILADLIFSCRCFRTAAQIHLCD